MDLTLRDRGVVLGEALVVADLHLGRERSSTVELSVGSERSLRERLSGLIAEHSVSEVVVAGDLLHAFDSLPPDVVASYKQLRDVVTDHGCRLVVTPGNHDVLLDAVRDGPSPEEYALSDGQTVVCHGHELPETDADRYVIGHDHPAIEIEGQKRPCYLHGTDVYRDADVLVLPAFNELVAGVTINHIGADGFHSPLIENVDTFRPIVRDDTAGETLSFPPLGSLRGLL
ncbi:metallophosphoesterase [Halorhabdus sp. CBA1104]|uniref:metallophosphoesterase n=1 Tax=Halorhabdus sp. CBA1104 TaxID=1380432 RepID=UPI0012B20C6F|nr:metallophosphoesterase [Halorhabdus sp. CBA1104]QGN06618.1 metallophosphoesterase [Halorhabdus sp. CBA1104]